ncbi:MAG: hypothetical protein JW737_03110 [Acidobacteria bacterium]|nr:hypothetical protein [Acidobacteriota bacterium]
MKKTSTIFFIFLMVSSLTVYSQTLVESQFSAAVGSGARAMGMGGAFIAVADDATAITWNPGGLGQIENIEISAVGSYYDFERIEAAVPLGDFRTGTFYQFGDSGNFDFFGITVPIRPFADSDFKIVLQYSYQNLINLNLNSDISPYYFEENYTNNGTQFFRYGQLRVVEEYSGGLNAHSIGLGIRLASWLDIGMTVNLWTGGYEGSRMDSYVFNVVNLETNESFPGFGMSFVQEEGDFTGTSFNFGALVHVLENLNFGAVFKTEFTFDDEDEEGNKLGEITYPYVIGFGLAYRPIENLTLAADITSTNWLNGKAVYGDETTFFPRTSLDYNPDAEADSEKQHNSNQLRFGAEYVFVLDDILLAFRGGVYFDSQYFSDANERIPVYQGLTGGIGIVWNAFVIDFAVVNVTGKYQENYLSAGQSDFSSLKAIGSLIIRL